MRISYNLRGFQRGPYRANIGAQPIPHAAMLTVAIQTF